MEDMTINVLSEQYQDSSLSNCLYLFAHWTVVIGIQHFDLHNGFRVEDTVTSSNVKEVIVLLFTVQGLPDRDLPFILNVLDCKLAKRVSSCLVMKRSTPL